MDLEVLSKHLLDERHSTDTVPKFSRIDLIDVKRQSPQRIAILRRFMKFLRHCAANRKCKNIPPMLKFICQLNALDDWLISSSAIVLPELNSLYCTILTEADPRTHQSPGKVNAVISSRLKQDTDAMRALCSVFEVCVSFCDLVDAENQQHLRVFLRTSAAVLFGSDFQRMRDTRNENDYAMDELARYSSYALSNVMLTYPAITPLAESILGKRLQCLFKFLYSSPELGISRSLILILRSLYQNSESKGGNSSISRILIDEEFSGSGPGRHTVLQMFREIDLSSEDAIVQAEDISLRMHSGTTDGMCFRSINCSVQTKQIGQVSRRRVPFRSASVDWNRNCFAVHTKDELPVYCPLFAVTKMEWKKGKTELHLTIQKRFGQKGVHTVIRFSPNLMSDSEKEILEERLCRAMQKTKFLKDINQSTGKSRKASQVAMPGKARKDGTNASISCAPGHAENISDRRVRPAEGSLHTTEAREKHIFSEHLPHSVYTYDSCAEEENKENSPKLKTDSSKESERNQSTMTDKRDFRHVVISKAPSVSDASDTGDHPEMEEAVDGGGSREYVPVAQSTENTLSSDQSGKMGQRRETVNHESFFPSPRTKTPTEESESLLELFHSPIFGARSFNDVEMRKGKDQLGNLPTFITPEVPRNHNKENVTIDFETCSFAACLEGKETTRDILRVDERLRNKLQSIASTMLQWKQKQSSQILLKVKQSIRGMREKCAKQDKEIVTKFANGLRKHSSTRCDMFSSKGERMRGALLNARKRINSLIAKLVKGRQQVQILKAKSSTDINQCRSAMQKEREELALSFEQSMADTLRRSKTGARKNSVLQSLARLLKEE